MEIKDILKPEEYASLNQINQADRAWLNDRIQIRRDGEPGVECVVRGTNSEGDYYKLTPEEVVRQYYAYKLISEYGYHKEQISFEEPVLFAGRQTINDKRIDICVFDKNHKNIIMVIEVKRPEIKDYQKTWEDESTTPYQQMQFKPSYCKVNIKTGIFTVLCF